MTAADQPKDLLAELAEIPVVLGNIAIVAGMIRADCQRCLTATDAETVVGLLHQIADYSDTIRDTAADMAEALGCGPAAVEVVREGVERLTAFRACKGLEGSA